MADLVRWLNTQIDADDQAALAWPPDQRVWEARPGAPGVQHSLEWDGFVCVEGSYEYGWERIKIARDDDPTLAVHIAEWDPDRVSREVDAKRRTLIRCQEAVLAASPMLMQFAEQTLREMALGYSHRPGYAEAVASVE